MFDFAAYGLIQSPVKRPLPGDGPQSVTTILDKQLADNPQRLALVGVSGRYTYADLDAQVKRYAAALRDVGIGRFDRLAVCLDNDVDIVIAFLACARLGAIWVGVNRLLAPPEKAFLLEDCAASLYLTDAAGAAEMRTAAADGLAVPQLLTLSALFDATRKLEADGFEPVDVDPFEPLAIAYTSGTTGVPKGAVHSHHNVLLPGAIAAFEGNFGPDDHQGVMLPLTILNLMVLAPLTAFQAGCACVCMDTLKPVDIAAWVAREKVVHFASVPTVIQDLLTSDEVDPRDLATLGCPDIGGAGIAKSFQELYRQRFGRSMSVAYGMTEAPTIVSKTDVNREPEEELCGRAVAQVEVRVVDEQDQPVGVGEIGEVCVAPATKGPYAYVYTTMLGYWRRRDATSQSLKHGMYHTGDLGAVDGAGELYIRGRKKELIIRGGANVYPAEVERVLVAHAAVKDAAVLGIDDERLGQRVGAVVELQESGGEPAEVMSQGLIDWCATRIARYKVPEQLIVVESLPRNAMNKVVKPHLLALFD